MSSWFYNLGGTQNYLMADWIKSLYTRPQVLYRETPVIYCTIRVVLSHHNNISKKRLNAYLCSLFIAFVLQYMYKCYSIEKYLHYSVLFYFFLDNGCQVIG